MKIGQQIPHIQLPAIDGSQFDNQSLKGKKYLLTFFRFATCPLCNIRIGQLLKIKKEFADNFEIVAIFESDIDHLKKHANKQVSQFPILADQQKQYYELFGVKRSVFGMLKGIATRMPTIIKGMLKGHIPAEVSSRYFIMPLSLLVDEKGVIKDIYQGKDEGDHIPLENVISFSKE